MMPAMFRRLARTEGFTLAEIILVVGVLAILVTMTTPALVGFLKQRDIRAEEAAQLQIQQALASLLNDTGILPADNSTIDDTSPDFWAQKLAHYTNLSPHQIEYDTWGNERRYVAATVNTTMLNTDVPIYYVTVLSRGPDLKATAETAPDGTKLVSVDNANNFTVANATKGWWKAPNDNPQTAANFAQVGVPAGSDDLLFRYTDYPDKIASYNTTLERMNKVSDALESYARAHYAERVAECAPRSDGDETVPDDTSGHPPGTDNCHDFPPEKQIHYPFSSPNRGAADSFTNYNGAVITQTIKQTGGTNYIYNGEDDALRQAAMVNLMRLLGLPDSYCCSALEKYTDSAGKLQELPFYYFSNPRPRTGAGGCGTRPTIDTPKLPIRLTTTANDSCG
jgi:type II secretory pathway pseudopilin PulG